MTSSMIMWSYIEFYTGSTTKKVNVFARVLVVYSSTPSPRRRLWRAARGSSTRVLKRSQIFPWRTPLLKCKDCRKKLERSTLRAMLLLSRRGTWSPILDSPSTFVRVLFFFANASRALSTEGELNDGPQLWDSPTRVCLPLR